MVTTTIDGNEKVIATAQKIVESFGTSMNLKHDMIRILSTFDKRFSNIDEYLSPKKTKLEERFEAAKNVILHWEAKLGTHSQQRYLWEYSIDETREYLGAVDEILELVENEPLLDRGESVIQMAMMRLEDEFHHLLVQNAVSLDGERIGGLVRRRSVSLASNDGGSEDLESSVDNESRDSLCEEESGGEDFCLELVNSDAVIDLKEIADRMIKAGYEMECCQVYTSVRREVLYECLGILGVDKMSIEEVQKVEWRVLDEKIKRWTHALKIVISVFLVGEKQLCERVFGGADRITGVCFAETAKGCVLQLLNFGEAVVIGHRSPEKLFRVLDMHDALASVLLDLQALFSGGSGGFVCNEARDILSGLGEAAKGTFAEFENAVQGETSRKPTYGGEVHPLARYVMNYIKLFVDYNDSLNFLLESSEENSCNQDGDESPSSQLGSESPMGRRLISLINSLESNLEEKSQLYEDSSMRYIFLMNNLLYILNKVKDSELGKLLGDLWVRKHRSQIRQYATGYLRASWSKVLSSLKDEGIGGSGSSSKVSKVALKERFKNFNAAFEEIYRNQTAWKVPDPQLRDELRISISERVLPAYRSFMGRFKCHLENVRHVEKYMKYTPEDLENHLLSLFEGSPKVLHPPRRHLST